MTTPPPELTQPERALEVQELLRRALNTWEGRPQWAVDWSDAVDAEVRRLKIEQEQACQPTATTP